jgi:alkylation response protein AidB-like acyl-CoA dehydrogenase
MESKILSRRDLEFVLYEMLDVLRLTGLPRYADHTRETFDAALDTARKVATDYFAPHNRKNDLHEPHWVDGKVVTIPEVSAALKAFNDAGLMAAGQTYELGGMQLPVAVEKAAFAYFTGANCGTASYPFLTIGNANLLLAHGSQEQVDTYVKPMMEGRFFGTMCLSEPQAGSSLADIRTSAKPQADGSYRVTGNKMWISAGEHELSENIIHLVLAKIEGAPAGVKGISLFVVPKFLVNADGTLGRRNDVALAGLNHKMGYRGTTNCLLNFGEKGDCVGFLVGEPHHGLTYMFHMMNEARIGVGLGATMLGYTGYLHSLDYARNRPQGRPVAGKDPQSPQVPLVQHADIRRMLLAQKSYVEAALALNLYCAVLVDEQQYAETEAERADAGLLLDLLTPIAKSWPSQWCLEANSLAIQILGGYGYTREYPVEQFYRDNRLNPIHEGTHGIQALDLLGRKVTQSKSRGLLLLAQAIGKTCMEAANSPDQPIRQYAVQLQTAMHRAAETTQTLYAAGDIEKTLANASVYLEMVGHVVIAWTWLRQALAASSRAGDVTGEEADFYLGKLQACAYFFRWELPKTLQWAELLKSIDTTTLDMKDAWF